MQYHWRHSVVWQIQNMETLKARPLMLLVVVLILGVLGVWEVKMASAGPSDAQCKEERRIGVNACKPVLYGKLPSPECCQRVRVTHIECVCRDITPNMAALIDLNRAVRLVEGCGRRVPRHYKCGSITTP